MEGANLCQIWALDMEISFVKCIFNSNCTKVILIKVMKAKMKYQIVPYI